MPESGRSSPCAMVRVVVLPAPLGPSSAVTSPLRARKSTPLRMWRSPRRLRTVFCSPSRDTRTEGEDGTHPWYPRGPLLLRPVELAWPTPPSGKARLTFAVALIR
ncbi:hypothetical protein ACFFX0_04045 [Citricoccus parietis]|uniref:Secreted protein n=1 Tax=Citricoccus parietis TaxID=592307 RepID=A0ABV5FUP3_9MICC